MRNILILIFIQILHIQNAYAQEKPALGRVVSVEELSALENTVLPNGEGLPAGSGNATDGKVLYQSNCLACHGAGGKGGTNNQLVGGHGTLTSKHPVKTVGSYWPFATTLYDYIHRAMPYPSPGSLTDDEVYAVTAYILFMNDIIEKDLVLNAKNLPEIKMPNHDNIILGYKPPY